MKANEFLTEKLCCRMFFSLRCRSQMQMHGTYINTHTPNGWCWCLTSCMCVYDFLVIFHVRFTYNLLTFTKFCWDFFLVLFQCCANSFLTPFNYNYTIYSHVATFKQHCNTRFKLKFSVKFRWRVCFFDICITISVSTCTLIIPTVNRKIGGSNDSFQFTKPYQINVIRSQITGKYRRA